MLTQDCIGCPNIYQVTILTDGKDPKFPDDFECVDFSGCDVYKGEDKKEG